MPRRRRANRVGERQRWQRQPARGRCTTNSKCGLRSAWSALAMRVPPPTPRASRRTTSGAPCSPRCARTGTTRRAPCSKQSRSGSRRRQARAQAAPTNSKHEPTGHPPLRARRIFGREPHGPQSSQAGRPGSRTHFRATPRSAPPNPPPALPGVAVLERHRARAPTCGTRPRRSSWSRARSSRGPW